MNRLRPVPTIVAVGFGLILAFGVPLSGGEPDLGKAREDIAHGRYAEGIKAIEAILPKATGKAGVDARALLVRACLETGEYKKAVAESARLEGLAPDSPDALCLHADALMATGQHEEAGKRIARARKLDDARFDPRILSLELAELTGDGEAAKVQTSYFFGLYREGKAKSAEALTAVARAAQRGDPHGAWRVYQEAERADPNYVEAFVRAGFHCLDKYAWQFASENFGKALKLNPNLAVAHAGLASVLLANSRYDKAQESIEAALKANPHLELARLLKASMLAVDQKREAGLAEIRAALAVSPNSPAALSMLAAHYEVVGNAAERDKAIAQALRINPKYADVYATLSLACERERRCPAAIAWARKAIELSPDYWRGYFLAGTNLLRAGEDREGTPLLERAFKLNGFNMWAFHMLKVEDRDLKKKEFVYHETPHFFVKLDKTEDAILWPYLDLMLEPMLDTLGRKYGEAPVGPKEAGGRILVLMFPNHAEFSARTVGLPGLGANGACLGQVITMPSPAFGRGMPGMQFNWRRVLLHEFCHVLTLQKTDYNVPRWFTEGISVLEDEDTRVTWDPMLARAVAHNELLPLEDLNSGFTRPKFPNQVPLSYYQGMLVCRYLSETFGFATLLKALDLFRDGRPTEQVLPEVTKKTMAELNKETLAYIRRYVEGLKTPPPADPRDLPKLEERAKKEETDPELWAQIAAARLAAGKANGAREAAKWAIAWNLHPLSPRERGGVRDSRSLARAYGVLGFIAYAAGKDKAAAKKHFFAAKEADPSYVPARLYLGLIAKEEGATEQAIAELEAARKLSPRVHAPGLSLHEQLADLYVKAGKSAKAIEALRELARVDTTNARGLIRLGGLLADADRPAEAAAAYLEAIYIDPFDPQTHLAAARAYEAADAWEPAFREYGVAAILDRRSLAALVRRAQTLAVAGRTEAARLAVAAIRRADPTNPEAAKIERLLKK